MLVTLAKFLDPWEAHVVRARLEAEGIPASVAFANHAIVNWPMSLALGGTRVQVPDSFLAWARQLLADYEGGVLEAELNAAAGLEPERCPRCGSPNFRQTMPWRERLWAVLIVLIVAAFPAKRRLFICRDCGQRWNWGDGGS